MAEVDQTIPSSESPLETNQYADLTMQPPVRKNLKPKVQEKLIKGAVLNFVPENPIGALYALFEKESFRLELMENQQSYKAVLRIDGRVFERVSRQKRKARDGVGIDALEYLFSDIVNDLRNRYREAFEQQNITMLSKQLACKKKKIPPPPLPTSVNRPPVKKELKPEVVERLVKRALGLIESENPNTVTALFSLFEKDVFEFEVKQLSQIEPKFQATLRVGDRWYSDMAASIKKVKSMVTKKALRDLFPEHAGPEHLDTCEETKSDSSLCNGMAVNGTKGTMDDGCGVLEASAAEARAVEARAAEAKAAEARAAEEAKRLCFSDFVANLVESYKEIVQDQPEHLRRYSVLPGIVMMPNNDTSTASVSPAHGKDPRVGYKTVFIAKLYEHWGFQVAENCRNQLFVKDVHESSNHYESGQLQRGDIVIKVNGIPVDGMTPERFMSMMTEQRGIITIEIYREMPLDI